MQNIKQFLREHTSYKILGITIFTSLGLLLSLFVMTKTINEAKKFQFIGRDTPAVKVLPVNGKGEVTIVADIATFTLSVIEEGKTASEAQSKATEKNNAIVKYLKENGVEAKDIQSTGYNVSPQYDYSGGCKTSICPPAKPIISGYEISQSLTVKVRKADDAGKILSGVGSLGASNISSLTFTSDNIDNLRKEARRLAIEDAQAQASTIASQLGIRLGGLVSFYEMNDPSYPEYYGKGGDTAVRNMAQSAPAPEIPRGETKIVSQVSLNYEIK